MTGSGTRGSACVCAAEWAVPPDGATPDNARFVVAETPRKFAVPLPLILYMLSTLRVDDGKHKYVKNRNAG